MVSRKQFRKHYTANSAQETVTMIMYVVTINLGGNMTNTLRKAHRIKLLCFSRINKIIKKLIASVELTLKDIFFSKKCET